MSSNNEFIKQLLAGREIALIGFADLSEVEEAARQGCQYGISIATALTALPSLGQASKEYYNEYWRVSNLLKETSQYLADKIKEAGYNAVSLAGQKISDRYRTPLPFKTLATRAGLGWIGKSGVLITKEYGNAIRLNGVLTSMPLQTGTPINESLCGSCTECVTHCPGKAIKGILWNVHTDRDELVDPFACQRIITERGKRFGVDVATCGICLSICPWTKRYIKRCTRS